MSPEPTPVSEQTFKVFMDEVMRRMDANNLALGALDSRMRDANGRTSKNETAIAHLKSQIEWHQAREQERERKDAERDEKIDSLRLSRAQAMGLALGVSTLSSVIGAAMSLILK